MTEGERKLAAIMFTDVVDYTLLSSRNENRALEGLKELRTLLEGVFRKHEGRVIKTMGDGFLVEFASAVRAVNCAVEAQREVDHMNAGRGADEKMMIRIGVHLGDVVLSEGDVLGDAVNVASRVHALAEPGGICVTRQVYDSVKGKVQAQIVSEGFRRLKNIPSPVEVFRVTEQTGPLGQEEPVELSANRVAILPFTNFSPDPNDGYFADGLTEELISTVSRIRELRVISRSSAMRFKDTTLSKDKVGQELGAGTILEGSVRKAGNRVRITAQLLNVESDAYIWSQIYDRDIADIFGVQGDIAERVAEGLRVELLTKEKQSLGRKSTASPEAYTHYLQGRVYWAERSKDGSAKAVRCFEKAIRLDPRFAQAYSGLADTYAVLADYGWMESTRAGALAKENAMKALAIDESLAEAHASLGLVTVNHFWDFETGEREFRRAIELNPNYAPAYHWYALMLWYSRKYDVAQEMMRHAGELDPASFVLKQTQAVALLGLDKTSRALERLKKLVPEYPQSVALRYWMAIAHLTLGEFREAVEDAEQEVQLDGMSSDSKLDLAYAQAMAGGREEASRLVAEATKADEYVSPVSMALVSLALGKEKEGFDWLKKACEVRDPEYLYFRSIPLFARYWSDPRVLEMERGAGLKV